MAHDDIPCICSPHPGALLPEEASQSSRREHSIHTVVTLELFAGRAVGGWGGGGEGSGM